MKTDVWLSIEWSSFLIHDQFINSLEREVISDSKIWFVPNLFLRRLTANGKVFVLADCLHLMDWGKTGVSGNKPLWGKTAPEHRELGSAFSSLNL